MKTKATKRGRKLTWKRAADEELDDLAEITEADIAEAMAFAKKYGSPRFAALLEADKSDAV